MNNLHRFLRFTLFPLIVLIVFKASFLYAFTGKVIKVSDGDTITVLTSDYQQIKVRLYGIDCPEKRQPFGAAATRFTRDYVGGQLVEVETYGKDRYGRVVGIVADLNEALLAAGLAWVYPQYCKETFCRNWRKIETSARQEKRGLWQDADPLPPWSWRRALK